MFDARISGVFLQLVECSKTNRAMWVLLHHINRAPFLCFLLSRLFWCNFALHLIKCFIHVLLSSLSPVSFLPGPIGCCSLTLRSRDNNAIQFTPKQHYALVAAACSDPPTSAEQRNLHLQLTFNPWTSVQLDRRNYVFAEFKSSNRKQPQFSYWSNLPSMKLVCSYQSVPWPI